MKIPEHYAYGVYHVGDQTFVNKNDALYYATQTRQDVRWDFHESTFSKVNWTQRPPGNILQLYQERARQIRENYDYVIVQFSGGADSWTVLDSFLSAGLHVDEIYTRWSLKEGDYKKPNTQDHREINLYSEYHYAVRPILDEVAKRYPRTRIYIDDDTEEYHNHLNETNFWTNGGHYLCIGTFHRFARKSPEEQEAVRRGQRVAVVHGFDKLQCLAQGGNFYAYFADKCGGTALDPDRSVEFFFWAREFPHIAVAQAHLLRDYYLTQTDQLELTEEYLRHSYISNCYPRYNLETFQVRKPAGSELWASKLWLHEYSPGYIESWQWQVDQYVKGIDSKFMKMFGGTLRLGYKLCRSPLYRIGSFPPDIEFDFAH